MWRSRYARSVLFWWLLLGLGLGSIVVPLIVGICLADEFHARVRLHFACSASAIWTSILDVERHPLSGIQCRGVTRLPSEVGAVCWAEDLGRAQLSVSSEVVDPEARVVLHASVSGLPMLTRWEAELLDLGPEGCELFLSNRTIVRSGSWRSPLVRLVMACSGGARKVLLEYAWDLAQARGVSVVPLDPSAPRILKPRGVGSRARAQ